MIKQEVVNILKKLNRHKILSSTFLVITLVVFGIILKTPLNNQLNSWQVLPQPERFSELYFTYPDKLPKKYTPGYAQTISFTVHNLQHSDYRYNYQIVETSQDKKRSQILQAGTILLKNNEYSTKLLNIIPIDLGKHVNVSARITNSGEEVNFWLDR